MMTQPAFRNRSGDAAASDLSDLSEMSDEDRSKDKFFHEVAALSNSMIAAHGREFSMGTLILAARFIAENKAFTKDPGTKDPGTKDLGTNVSDSVAADAAACCGGGGKSIGSQEHDHAHHKS
jgi:hypothetical protein